MRTSIALVALTLSLACSTSMAAEPALPSVPAVLRPLKAKISTGHWGFRFKGTVLEFTAEKPLNEEQWKAIEELGIRLIAISNATGIDDAAAEHLAKMDLLGLVTDASQFTDEGFRYLAKMKSLRTLAFFHPSRGVKNFTGSGFAYLKDLPDFESLTFAGSTTGNEAMVAIGKLTQLKDFSTWHTQQSDPRNLHLLKLSKLKSLTLGNSITQFGNNPRQFGLTEATLSTLARMKSLENLHIKELRTTFPALEQLAALPNLKKLNLEGADIPADDVERLRAKMPGVAIEWKPLPESDRKRLEEALKSR